MQLKATALKGCSMPRHSMLLVLTGFVGCATNPPVVDRPGVISSAGIPAAAVNMITPVSPSEQLVTYSEPIVMNEMNTSVAAVPVVPTPLADDSDKAIEASNVTTMNLPSALAMVSGEHPVVGFARWRVQEAYAQLQSAEVMWLPSIQSGFSFRKHDGNYQAIDGSIVDVDLNSFHYGLGVGATAAGTPTRPGLVAEFHLADAIFAPQVAEKTAWARGHAASAVLNQQLLNAALAYLELLDAHQDARIVEESRERMAALTKITTDYAEAGQGLRSDSDRMQTELTLIDNRYVGARERIAVSSARLTRALSLDGGEEIIPMDVTVVPLELVPSQSDKPSLISTGLGMRPELKEAQSLVAAACEAYRREKYAPFVPSVLLGFSTGGFGGGKGNNLDNIDGRYDIDALMSWELRNLGFGEQAARRTMSARVQLSKFEQLQLMDQVAFEVSEAYSQVQFRRDQIAISERAIRSADESYERNTSRIREGQGLPLEVLQSVQALETAQRTYLRAVIDYNQAQLRLQWALGWPVDAAS
jgi:outer membrane protein TolC